eukprot:CAMPEP_0197835240 /NCGR_PEP_ID=MMETSP1437-20131217/25192_1 /TAXON_ID=49252 ORGANISM="Eucampia antarctica, Strain CCMP1452" /NCGR_SAMPLE_ID=MMETSP1437 /ASSEMBLY_ACC=CAM_ASM_001096 /LENGTH=305 /DNA_ID=CAMNT_0043440517 /DNA_START=51 /DNA_END=968 /DNA_ORIENTATION=+
MKNGGDSYNNDKTRRIPFFSSMFRKVYLALPKSESFDVSMMMLSCGFFGVIRLAGEHTFVSILGWEESHKMTRECPSYCAPIVHSIFLCLCLAELLSVEKYVPTSKMKDAPLWWQQTATACLQFCTGYMIYDSLFIVRDKVRFNESLKPADYMFIGHHLATTLYMSSVRRLGAGHSSAMMLMLLGEFTNPLQSVFTVVRYAVQMEPQRQLWHTLLPFCELIYALFYAVFRTFLGPFAMAHITYHLIFTKQGRTNIPIFATLCYLIMGWGVLIGSIGWTMEAIEMARDGWTVKYDSSYDYGPAYKL